MLCSDAPTTQVLEEYRIRMSQESFGDPDVMEQLWRNDKVWATKFAELLQARQECPLGIVNIGERATSPIGKWVRTQRRAMKSGKITVARKAALDHYGFIFDEASSTCFPKGRKDCPSCGEKKVLSVRKCNYEGCEEVGCITESDDGCITESDLSVFAGCLTVCQNTETLLYHKTTIPTGCAKSPFYCADHKGGFCIDRRVCKRCVDYAIEHDKLEAYGFI